MHAPDLRATRGESLSSVTGDRLFTRDFLFLLCGIFGLAGSMMLPQAVMPLYVVGLGGREADVGLVMGMFGVGAAFVRPVVGWQLDRGDRVRLLTAAGVVVAATSFGYAVLGALGGALLLLYPLRLPHGVGMATQYACGQVLSTALAPPRRRAEAIGWQGAAMSACAALAPPLGFAMLGLVGPPVIFAVAAGGAALGVVLLSRVREPIRESTRPRARFFHRAGVAPGFVLLWTFAAMAGVMTFAPIFAVANGLANPGLFFTAYSGGAFLGQAVGGRAADRFNRTAVVVPGLLVATAGVALIPASGGFGLVGCSALIGVGFALAQPGLFADVMDRATVAERGAIFATSGIFIEIGVAGGPTLMGLVAEGAGLPTAFHVIAGGHAATCLAFLMLRWLAPARAARLVPAE